MANQNYIIDNIEEFAENSRRLVFNHFGEQKVEIKSEDDLLSHLDPKEEKELDSILSLNEAIAIVISLTRIQKHKKTQDKRYIINDKIFVDILEALNTRLVSNILINLTNKGLIESAYDSTLDDFVFWVKNEDENKKS
jgi:hypothetical protein